MSSPLQVKPALPGDVPPKEYLAEKPPSDKPLTSSAEPFWDEVPKHSTGDLLDEKTFKDLFSASPANPGMPAGREEQGELDRIRAKVAAWDSEADPIDVPQPHAAAIQSLRFSEQIHVMGFNPVGRHITHTLAGCETIPPVRWLFGGRRIYSRWVEAGKELTLHRGDDIITHRRVVGEYFSQQQSEEKTGKLIENLIVTLPASLVVRALENIHHRLDHRSTICLVNDGLGVAEALIETYFPNELKRPTFLLGHFTAALDPTNTPFSVAEIRPGRLYLSLFTPPPLPAPFRIKRHPPVERTARGTHLLRLLKAMPHLKAVGLPMPDFLHHKLPTLAFRAVADPLAALYDCRYEELRRNPHARQLMDRLTGEVARVASRLPECRASPRFRPVALAGGLRDEVLRKLVRQRTADSKMRAHARRGWSTDVEFLLGYFVRRGREVGVDVAGLESVMWSVKAKMEVLRKRVEGDVPFETE